MKAEELAKELLETAKKNEPQITKDLRSIADSNKARIVGLENKFKSEKSLSRKLLDYSESREIPLKAMAKMNNDTLRYTYLLNTNNYSDDFEGIIKELEKRDYRIKKVFNAWKFDATDDTGYRGINVTVISSQKQKFELQLHTRESFDLKTETHTLYEELRSPLTSEARKKEIIKLMIEKAEKLERPQGL